MSKEEIVRSLAIELHRVGSEAGRRYLRRRKQPGRFPDWGELSDHAQCGMDAIAKYVIRHFERRK